MGKVLIAGVGHRFWRDLSAGVVWSDRLKALPWPAGVSIEDYGFGALAMAQRLEEERYEKAIFLTAEIRGQPPGSLRVYRYAYNPGSLPPLKVHDHFFEAVAGAIAIDLLLVVAGHLKALPPETWVVEVEPKDTGWGEGLSPEIEACFPEALAEVRRLIAEVAHAP